MKVAPILLDEKKLSAKLSLNTHYQLHIFKKLDSTNRFLKTLALDSQLQICCAESQTQGQGRFGRHWQSPFAENIYCSSRWPIYNQGIDLSALSLVIGLAVIAFLKRIHLQENITIKWPNDILWKDKKLAGILIELLKDKHERKDLIIGIGINVNTNTLENPLPDRPWCSLFEITGKYFDRNTLVALLLMAVENYLNDYLKTGFAAFKQEWQRHDALFGKTVTVSQASQNITGIALGVHDSGELIIEDSQGILHYIHSGDASLKPS